MVAALTGANILKGTATAAASGSTVRLSGGGELMSSTPAEGPVQIAVHPWELELADPKSSKLTDNVISVRHEHGGLLIRLTRFTIQTQPHENGHPVVQEGSTVGLRVAPSDVRVVQPSPSPPGTTPADNA